MIDNDKVTSYQDALLDSFGIIAKQIVSELQYDKTILCQVIDDSKKSQGQYTVSDGSLKFIAYAEGAEYKNKENVYVNIPNGDFNNEKFIVGRKLSSSTNIYNYREPFDQIVDLTGNLNSSNSTLALTANGSKIETEPIIIDVKDYNIVDYSWLGIKAEFKSLLKTAIFGSYGLRVELITVNKAIEPIIFDSSKFFGNSYNFINYTEQQQLFNIKDKDKIDKIKIYFYQTNNFISSNGEKIAYEDNYELSNLFVNNIYICAGNDQSEISDDIIEVYSKNGKGYNNNNKPTLNLALRWIHKDQDKIINIYKQSDIPKEYNIKWYRYSYNSDDQSDFAGLFWTKLDNDNELFYDLSTNLTFKEEKIQIIITQSTSNGEIIYKKSPILILSNETIQSAENDFLDFSNSLRIITDDDTNGYYYLYSESGPLISDLEGNKERHLIAQFKNDNGDYENLTQLNSGEVISWQFPINNSMMKLYTRNESNGEYQIDLDQISSELNPMYKINEQYVQTHSNNQVVCTLVKNGKNYQATKNFAFAPKYTLTSGKTMKIFKSNDDKQWENNYFYIDVENNQVSWEIYDEMGNIVPLNGQTFEISLVNSQDTIFVVDNGQHVHNYITNNNYILLKRFGDDDLDKSYIIKIVDMSNNLTAYFPIVINLNDNYYVSGPNEVFYLQDGKINYSQDKYKLYNKNNEEILENITYNIIPEDRGWSINNNKLLPSNIYIQNQNYAIQVSINGQKIITYPILNIQNTNASTSLNNIETSQITINENKIENALFSTFSTDGNGLYSGLMIGTYNGSQGIFGFEAGKLVLEISANGRIKIDNKELYVDGSTLKLRD